MQEALLKARRELLRWRILAILNTARPGDLGEGFISSVCNDLRMEISLSELRRELDYLDGRKLIAIERQAEWLCRITPYGVDLVEYTADAVPGIARPPKNR